MNKFFTVIGTRPVLFAVAIVLGVGVGVLVKQVNWGTDTVHTVSDVSSSPQPTATDVTADNEWVDPNGDQPVYVVETDDDNNKTAAGFYQNGKRAGHWEIFHPNGELRAVGKYQDDVKVGVWRTFYTNGAPLSEGRYDDEGLHSGLWTRYYPNGNRRLEGKYTAGVKIGTWLGFPYENHPDHYWYSYFNSKGQRHSEWRWYSGGKLRVLDKYDNGKLQSRLLYNGGFQVPGAP